MKPDRDRAVERLLTRTLGAERQAVRTPACFDAETLAAWVEGALAGAELERVDAHLAGCPRCQSVLAAIGRSTPAAPAPEGWLRRHAGLGWLVPLAASAAAVALWVAVPRVDRPAEAPPEVSVGAPRAAAEPPSPPPARSAAETDAARSRLAPAAIDPKASSVEQKPAEAFREERTVEAARPVDGLASPGADTPGRVADASRADAPASAAAAAPAAAAPPSPAPVPPASPAAAAESVTAGALAARASARLAPTARIIASPDPAVLWRIAGPGPVQRSVDGGVRWEAVATGVPGDLTSGSAPTPTVLWLAGRAGVVLRTTDGRSFERVASPAAVDFVAVEASDALTAVVTAADGRRFRTADGGRSWTSLQEF